MSVQIVEILIGLRAYPATLGVVNIAGAGVSGDAGQTSSRHRRYRRGCSPCLTLPRRVVGVAIHEVIVAAEAEAGGSR